MTKSTITRERLEEIVSDPMINQGSEFAMMARMALAAMESEADCKERKLFCSTDTARMRKVISASAGTEDAPLYRHAQPAPAVPDELLKEYLRLVQCMLSDYRDGNYGNAQRWIRHIAKASDDFERKHGISPWEMARKACRAAMLKAQPQNAPQNIPEIIPGWIPVSEQMPPSRHEVLVGRWWGEKLRWCCKWATYIPGHPDAQSSGWLIPGASWTPTHWMTLPAAPQEVE